MNTALLPGFALKMFHHVSLAAALVMAAVPAFAQQGYLRYGGQPYRQLPPQVMIQPYAGPTPMYPQRIQQFRTINPHRFTFHPTRHGTNRRIHRAHTTFSATHHRRWSCHLTLAVPRQRIIGGSLA